MESFHPEQPLVASELPSPLVSKPPKEFADETSSTASEAATSLSASAATTPNVATIDHHHHPVGNVSFFCIKSLFGLRCPTSGDVLRLLSLRWFLLLKTTLEANMPDLVFDHEWSRF